VATTPPTITALPTPPSTGSPGDFDARADAFMGAMPTLQSETNLAATNVYNNAVDAYNQAIAANNSANTANASSSAASGFAVQAASNVGAALWVSGTTYALGACVWSPYNKLVYRRIVAGAGTTDPYADATNWALPGAVLLTTPLVIVSATTQTAIAGSHYVLTNVALSTLTLPAGPAAGDTVWVTPANDLFTNVISRNGATIMGIAEDMTIDTYTSVQLRFVNSSWRIL